MIWMPSLNLQWVLMMMASMIAARYWWLFSSQRSPGGFEPRHRQRSQDHSRNYGQVRHLHHESSKMNIIEKIRILFLTFNRFRDLPPDPTECGCLKTLVRDKILRFEIFLHKEQWITFRPIKVEMFLSSNLEGAFQAGDLRIEGSSGSGASPGFWIPFFLTWLFSVFGIFICDYTIWHVYAWFQIWHIHIFLFNLSANWYLVLPNSSCLQFLANWPSVMSQNSCLTPLKYPGSSTVHSRGLHQDKIHQPAN